jgi:outer membrane protein assembly factor BamB
VRRFTFPGDLRAVVLVVAVLWGAAVSRLAWGQTSADWTTFQGGPEHQGSTMGAGVRPPLGMVWRAGPQGDSRLSAPVVTAALAVSTGRTSVVGFDPASGEILWEVDRAEGLAIPPALDRSAGTDGILVFIEGSGPRDSRLVAIELPTQSRLWEVDLGAQARGAPSIEGGRVFVGTRDQVVFAVDVESGSVLWTARTQGIVSTAPAVAGGTVFVVAEDERSGRSRLHALDAATGRARWGFSPPGVSVGVSSATVAGGMVYVGFGDFTLRGLDADTGRLTWTTQVRGPFSPHSAPAFADGDVFAVDRGGGVYRLDGESGLMEWDFQFPALATWGAPLVLDGTVYVGLDDGLLAAVDVATGHLVWRTRLRFGALGPFAPAGDLLLVSGLGQRGGVIAFEHDPGGTLTDIPSPTELDLPAALRNFGASFGVMLVALIGFFRFVVQRRRRILLSEAEEVGPAGVSPTDLPGVGGPNDGERPSP